MYLPNETYTQILILAIISIPITMLFFSHVPTPYGRFYQKDVWGPDLDEKNAWCIMESTGLFMFLLFYFLYGARRFCYVPLLFLGLWIFHYINRALIYPYAIMKQKYKKFPLLLVILGFFYLSMFSYLNAKNVSSNPKYTIDWIKKPVFIIGVIIFFIGFIINVWADCKLQQNKKKVEDINKENNLTDKKETKEEKEDKIFTFFDNGKFNFSKMFDNRIYFETNEKKHYHLPSGGLYNYISSPNYLGEIIEWSGWAIATWSLPGLLFALGAVGCIGVRALHTHKWYEKNFENMPKDRKALIPFIL
jgi:protein-S-isoprenylcysteine O-methyltransferase Ste14